MILDDEIYLEAINLGKTIEEENKTSQDRTKTMIFFRHHLYKELKVKYLIVKNHLILCVCVLALNFTILLELQQN